MKKLSILLFAIVLLFGFAGMANATTTWWEFTIDGADLMSYQIANGAVGDTALVAGLYEGARLYRSNEGNGDLTGDAIVNNDDWLRSYWAASNDEFVTWTSTTDRLADFNLWGYDGNGLKWGEYYKVQYWNEPTSTVPGWSSDSNWDGYITDWPWGSFDAYADSKPDYGAHYNDGRLLGWEAASYSDGLGFGDSDYPTFTFRIGLNDADPFFGTGGWHDGVEGQLVLWFGGSMMDSDSNWKTYYEGNIILQGTASEPVPEPATMLLLGSGLIGLAGFRRRFRKR